MLLESLQFILELVTKGSPRLNGTLSLENTGLLMNTRLDDVENTGISCRGCHGYRRKQLRQLCGPGS